MDICAKLKDIFLQAFLRYRVHEYRRDGLKYRKTYGQPENIKSSAMAFAGRKALKHIQHLNPFESLTEHFHIICLKKKKGQ